MAQPTVLLCNFTQDRRTKLNMICMRHKIRIRHVQPEEYGQTLAALCGLAPMQDGATSEATFADEVLLMANFTPALANSLLAAMRQARISVPLKAVLTPTNAAWTLPHLRDELAEEAAGLAAHTDAE